MQNHDLQKGIHNLEQKLFDCIFNDIKDMRI